ncbi:MAG TPA: SAM-dependent methyltransferase [Chryseolinea sp.]|nr:SAM-dependent methyltransferase [Chryseolinea sp.]
MTVGKLYLIPNIIADNTQDAVITAQVKSVLPGITHFLAEDVRTARRFLSSLKIYDSIEPLHFDVLDKDTDPSVVRNLLSPVFEGFDMGIISESGCPGVADPGALAVRFAHDNNIQVIPLVGPSSILLALMASGLNGQHFAFHGYLPIDTREAEHSIRSLEKDSRLKNQTQVFIETPYRSNALFQLLIKTLGGDTLLCIAENLTGNNEIIKTAPIKKWRNANKILPKEPAVFLFLAI